MKKKLLTILAVIAILISTTNSFILNPIHVLANSITEMPWGYLMTLDNGDTVEIGDSTTEDFRACVKTIHNDCWFQLELQGGGTYTPSVDGLVTSFDWNSNIHVAFYPADNGGIEYDVRLDKKQAQLESVTFDIDWSGITWQKVYGLDVEYNEARCEADFDGVAPYVITPTSITDDDGVIWKTRLEKEVNSYIGIAVEPNKSTVDYGKGITYTNLSKTYLYIHRGQMTDALNNTAWIEDINIDEDNKTITFYLPKDWLKTAEYPVSQVCGVDPAYSEQIDSFLTSAELSGDSTWSDVDLFTDYSIPKGAVVEVICANQEAGVENDFGVRTDGSSLARIVTLHEAEGGGETHCRIFVVCHATTGLAEFYHSDISDDDSFYLVGYWENVGFTELPTGYGSLGMGNGGTLEDASWNDFLLGQLSIRNEYWDTQMAIGGGVSYSKFGMSVSWSTSSDLYGFSCVLYKYGNPTGTAYIRVRKPSDDSLLGTLGSIDVSTLTTSPEVYNFNPSTPVTTDAGEAAFEILIEYDGGDSSNYILAKYNSTNDGVIDLVYYDGTYYDDSSSSLTCRVVCDYGGVGFGLLEDKLCHVLLVNSEDGSANYMGIRELGSSLSRYLLSHEPETGGANYLDMFIKTDSDSMIEAYCTSDSGSLGNLNILVTGYFGSELDFVELWQQITNDGDSDWDATDLTTYLDQDGRVVDFLLGHHVVDADHTLGVRDGDDSSTARYLVEHEAEDNGSTTGEVTGFSMSAQTNASGVVNLYSSTASEDFYLTGYFKPAGGLDISLDIHSYGFGFLMVSETANTGLTYFTVTNNGGDTIDITIHGEDMTGTGVTWTLSDTATAGDATYGLKAGLSGGSYNIIVKKTVTYNFLVEDLASSGTQEFGLEIYAPTANIGGVLMTGDVTLTASLAV